MSEIEIKVPNIGDFKDVEVIEVLVSEGQAWPSETKTSITSTSLKSPILGTFISISDIIILLALVY